jgi:Ataxin-1 and HBP1 module (AXH)
MNLIMKKYVLLFSIIFINNNYSQISTINNSPIKSPEATAFVNANFMNLDEFTGKVNITIPLYTINLDGLEIPISLSYDTGGVKVNTTASNVGLNWSLNAGGLISKEIKGENDLLTSFIINPEYTTNVSYIKYGFLRHLLKYTGDGGIGIATAGIDNQPDKFYVNAPGLITNFIHTKDGIPLEITKYGNSITGPFTDSRFQNEPFLPISVMSLLSYSEIDLQNKSGFKFGFKIKNTNGFEYSFYDVEKNVTFYKNIPYYIASPSEITAIPFHPDNINNIETEIYKYSIYPEIGRHTVDAYPTIKLSKIKSPVSNKEIQFVYEDNKLVDNNQHIDNYANCTGDPLNTYDKTTIYEHDYILEKLLKSINFPEGNIIFTYDGNRLDLRGGKILKKIEVRNNEGILIKGISFDQSYFDSVSDCNDNFYCKRLRLDRINIFDNNNIKLPGYFFEYNNTPLPKRFSVDQDFLGFYNGNSNLNVINYKSKVYFKPNQGKFSYLPFNFNGYSLICDGNGNKEPNINYAKAGSISRLNYPTGATTLFDFELHSFNLQTTEIPCGGLRLKNQSIYDNQNILQKKLEYNYMDSNGLTSGKILNLPNFISESIHGESLRLIYQNYNNKLELNNSSAFVGYSQVKIQEVGNGYTINKYSDNNDNPNIYPTPPTVTINPYHSDKYNLYFAKLNNGLIPSIFKDFSVKRGNLLSSEIYNNNNSLVKSIYNEYAYNKYDEFPVSENQTIINRGNYVLNSEVFAKFDSSIDIQSNVLINTITKDYFASGQITNTNTFSYYADKPILNEKTITNSKGNIIKQKIYYPFDSEVSNLPNVSTLNSQNIFKPIKEVKFLDNDVVGTNINSFKNLGNNKIVLENYKNSKGNQPLEIIEQYNLYDKKSNLMEYKSKDGIIHTILYGYDYESKIAEIEGATYQDVLTALGITNLESLQTKSNSELKIIFDNLRILLPLANIISYTYLPLVGVTSISDSKGQTNYFEYDSYNRLIRTKDNNNNIISEQTYNYSVIPNNTPIFQEILTVEIEKKPVFGYSPYTSASTYRVLLNAKIKGGQGNYNYEWRLATNTAILSRSANYNITIPCGTKLDLILTVIDGANNSVIKNVTVNAANCNEPFYAGPIEGSSGINNRYNFWINTEGGSYKFSYRWWYVALVTSPSITLYTNSCPNFLSNSSTAPYNATLYVEILDLESGKTVVRSKTVTIYPEFIIPSCFIAGTKIILADGTKKNIENILVGDKVATFSIENNKIEVGVVEEITTPVHDKFVKIEFSNNITNSNTYDHPYYVKNKGWCSYDPNLTKYNYKLDVQKIEVGDVVYQYNNNKTIELKIKSIVEFTKEQKTYNLQKVSKNHNFFANGILVHNKSSKL